LHNVRILDRPSHNPVATANVLPRYSWHDFWW